MGRPKFPTAIVAGVALGLLLKIPIIENKPYKMDPSLEEEGGPRDWSAEPVRDWSHMPTEFPLLYSKSGKKLPEYDAYYSVPQRLRCQGSMLDKLERSARRFGPDYPILHGRIKTFVADCPDLPPGVAEAVVRMKRKERLLKESKKAEENNRA